MNRIVVIGGGLSGLSAAVRMRERMPEASITVLEERNRPGGNIHTERRDGYTIEHGPNGFLDAKPSTLQLSRDLGLGERLLSGSEAARKNRFLYWNDKLQMLPGDPLGIFGTRLLSWRGKLAMLREPFRGTPRNLPADESVAEFARRRFGKEAAAVFIDALVTGIHAGDPEKLSVRAAFPRLTKFELEAGSVFRGVLRSVKAKKLAAQARGEKPMPQRMWSFPGGLQELVDAMADRLGANLVRGVRVKRIERSDDFRSPASTSEVQASGFPKSKPDFGNPVWIVHGEGTDRWTADVVVNTAPAFRQAEQVDALDAAFAAELASIRFAPVSVAVLGYRREHAPQPDGFGYIAPQATRRDVLGVQWCSTIYPGRAPQGYVLWRALCGGTNRPDAAALPDGELLNVVQREMQTVMGVSGPPAFSQVVRWPNAIPQYETGHPARVERLEQFAGRHPGLFLGGNSFHGIAMSDCTEQAERLAERVAAYRR
jgi:oxygen-dependent protoporphyrinogen oxidase